MSNVDQENILRFSFQKNDHRTFFVWRFCVEKQKHNWYLF